jgi:hypothetical protein
VTGSAPDPEALPDDAAVGAATTDPRRSRLPIVLGGLALVAAAVAVGALLMGGADEEDEPASPTYSAAVEAVFIEACTADGGEPVRPVCECFYDGIVETIPFDRYEEVNRLLLASPPSDGEPLPIPDDFEAILAECRQEAAAATS